MFQVEVRVLDVNDNAPVLAASATNVTILSDIDPFTPIVMLHAQDRDLSPEFDYSLEDSSGLFRVHPKLGFVTVFDRLPQINSTYHIVPIVSDGLFVDKMNITIKVITPPSSKAAITTSDYDLIEFTEDAYEFVVEEGKSEAYVGQVDVNTTSHVIFSIFPENINEYFKIDKKNGRIYTRAGLQYTAMQSTYSFLVSAELQDASSVRVS
ncbi:unnamed protein product [Soboliphyme baturini]|uniref:Cadherin domain-containing protein n=1 Tax=Soboliphyme baturini TaxID=241478 RepID=A0A3P8EFP8_9BILA|nr:unnamed protein product [Soboliphyme baturini]